MPDGESHRTRTSESKLQDSGHGACVSSTDETGNEGRARTGKERWRATLETGSARMPAIDWADVYSRQARSCLRHSCCRECSEFRIDRGAMHMKRSQSRMPQPKRGLLAKRDWKCLTVVTRVLVVRSDSKGPSAFESQRGCVSGC